MKRRPRWGSRVHVDTGYEASSWSGIVFGFMRDDTVLVSSYVRASHEWVRREVPLAWWESGRLQPGCLPKRERL